MADGKTRPATRPTLMEQGPPRGPVQAARGLLALRLLGWALRLDIVLIYDMATEMVAEQMRLAKNGEREGWVEGETAPRTGSRWHTVSDRYREHRAAQAPATERLL